MYTLQSKLKIGYISRTKPLFTGNRKQAIKPSKNSPSIKKQRVCFEQIPSNSSQNQQPDKQNDSSSINAKITSTGSNVANQYFRNPHSSIGLITCQQAGLRIMGTGFLVGPNLVLTSAQNIWSFKEKKVGSSIAFWPMFKNSLEGRAYSARKVNVPNELHEGQTSVDALLPFNFAVIELECGNLEHEYGTMALDFSAKTNSNEEIIIIGYACYGKNNGLCEMAGLATFDEDQIRYEVNAGYGICGAPILQKRGEDLQVIGIHIYSRQRQGKAERGGLKFNQKMLSYLKIWCTKEEEEVDLREKQVGKEGLKQLSKRKWKNLTALNLSRNALESSSAKYLKNGNWKNIIELDLGGNSIRKEGAEALVMSQLSAITTLNLWGNGIGKRGAYCISLSCWEELTNLNLYNNDIGDEGVKFLTQANWIKLTNINLGKNSITADGSKEILQGKWADLTSLNLWGNNLKGEQAHLKSLFLGHFRNLKYLYL